MFLNILGIETVKMMMTMKKIQFQQEMMWKKKVDISGKLIKEDKNVKYQKIKVIEIKKE